VEYLKTGIRILNRAIEEQLSEQNNAMLSLFAKGLELLDDYDHESLDKKGSTTRKIVYPEFNDYMGMIHEMYSDFKSDVFAQPKDESNRLKLDWDLQRTLSKVNYTIHTDAIKEKLIPKSLTKKQTILVYASEADILNMALFGVTASKWRILNSDKKGNIRDQASLEQLVVLSNLESINSVLIHQGLERFILPLMIAMML
jgi:hypothetical protein